MKWSTMKRIPCVIAVALFLFAVGCRRVEPGVLSRYGLMESVRGRQIVEQAILLVDVGAASGHDAAQVNVAAVWIPSGIGLLSRPWWILKKVCHRPRLRHRISVSRTQTSLTSL
jgi:hypothetical protein